MESMGSVEETAAYHLIGLWHEARSKRVGLHAKKAVYKLNDTKEHFHLEKVIEGVDAELMYIKDQLEHLGITADYNTGRISDAPA